MASVQANADQPGIGPLTLAVDFLSKDRPPFLPLVVSNLILNHSASSSTSANQVNVVEGELGAEPVLVLPDGSTVTGATQVAQKLASAFAATGMYGSSQAQSKEIDQYFAQGDKLLTADFATLSSIADEVDQHLALRTFFVGHSITAGDAAIYSALRSSSAGMGLVRRGTHKHLARWYKYLEQVPAFSDALAAITSAKSNKDRNKKAASSFDLFLGDNPKEGSVVTRFPPEPSGYLHVGHAKAAILNQYFAQKYKGKLIVRFDDTNPSKEKMEFEDSIVEDLALMGIQPDIRSHTSDFFDELYRQVNLLIQQGDAYADDTLQEQMRAERMDGIASKRRDSTVEETMERFAEMTKGTEEGRKWCLRAKMSVDNPNKAMRDPVIYRCNIDVPHHRTGAKWKVYPTYDFAAPVVDSLEGVTHALRTNEYRDRNPQYYWFIEKLNLRKPQIWDFARLNFIYTLLSKRKLQWFVDRGHVHGWDDPRFPTIRGIRRRGMTIDCIQQFILATGPAQQVVNMEWDTIWALNKKIIDPVVPRFTAIEINDMVTCHINGAPPSHEKAVAKHKKNIELGTKTTTYDSPVYIEQVDAQSFAEGEEITLMDWGNVFVKSKRLAADGKTVESLELDAHFEGDFSKTDKKVTWLAKTATRPLVDVALLEFDYLITKKKLEEEDHFEDYLTPETEFRYDAVAAFDVSELAEGAMLQFERKGYYILDKAQGKDGRREFIKVPDGKAAGVASKHAGIEKTEDQKAKKQAAKSAQKAKDPQVATQALTTACRTKSGTDSAFDIGQDASKATNMYKMPQLTEDVDTPALTSMYTMKPLY
ncbi:glutamyl-tRNA synthetase [Tilletiaria anomala UBC 951]|uniref:glutamate--tRNA ligase n=1 Tax=Tilletiaria anomala (strain ATCC 24038 / CBS 436.72 / UBC 951) TaxID=1037660 RepID=A0A066WPP6_TILAU|nr:glutamyl-tRNA synthetase [Tilletiaria anomala UBC 951]KDN52964.1 glutamyl-tRNA synthetase [Tilletiaria anomala UBC 951]